MDAPISKLSKISDAPENPMELLNEFIMEMVQYSKLPFLPMNIATLNKKYGVLNRTVIFRGLTDDEKNVIFYTEKNSQKYKDIKDDNRIAATILVLYHKNENVFHRQIRISGTVDEFPPEVISTLWAEEPAFAKVRSIISECGKPVDWNDLKHKHDELIENINNNSKCLKQTNTFTAFKIIPNTIDFYYAEADTIGDRVVYRKSEENSWSLDHVYP